MTAIRFGVLYGFRNPPSTGMTFHDFYARSLQQIELVDRLGFDHVWITEHHFVDDGYMPSPLVMSGAIAARTERVQIGQDVMLLPFAHPVRLAEDLSVLDNLSGGRMMLGAGMGYVPSEFAAMGVARHERRARMDETLEILQRAWTFDEFDYTGDHYQLSGVRVRPRPVQENGPLLWIAAMGEAGARRAARFGAHLLPQGDRLAVLDPYLERVDPARARVGIARAFFVDDDPAARQTNAGAHIADLAEGRSSAADAMDVYQKWFAEVSPRERMMTQLVEGAREGRLIPQNGFTGTARECIAEIERMHEVFAITDIFVPGMSGTHPVEVVDANLRRLAAEVIPHFRD